MIRISNSKKTNVNNTIVIDKINGIKEYTIRDGEQRTFVILSVDGEDKASQVRVNIKGSKANAQILGIVIGSGEQHINLSTLQDHIREESVSDLLIKSVLFDSSHLVYKGLVRIEPGAQKSNAYQKNQNILASSRSWAESKPELEICANDVRCTHGATIGKLPFDQLYYLQTRGFSQRESESLLLQGFLREVIQRIPDAVLQREIDNLVTKKIDLLLH